MIQIYNNLVHSVVKRLVKKNKNANSVIKKALTSIPSTILDIIRHNIQPSDFYSFYKFDHLK